MDDDINQGRFIRLVNKKYCDAFENKRGIEFTLLYKYKYVYSFEY